MPRTKKGHANTSGISRQTADGVFYVDGRYMCQRLENGTPCNREMAGTSHSITSHNSDFHAEGSYRRQMARGEFNCIEDGCSHQSPTFAAILGHIRRRHAFKGSSDQLKIHYGIPICRKRKADKPKEDSRKKTRTEGKEEEREETRVGVNNVVDGESTEDDRDEYEGLEFIDPRLLQWHKDNGGSGHDRFGDGGSGLGGQILSSNVIDASS
ncbi:hypothetical protein GQX73_g680 [Xylaria multiplex]|uniref:Uncharacterized protein n=1 Tax=Xylaria multiplex TaxID=323545 RepID=A0A7C8IZ66_9PEZI|nr:hypothetical protein GQX73_g680 [Xylaria multiplex]